MTFIGSLNSCSQFPTTPSNATNNHLTPNLLKTTGPLAYKRYLNIETYKKIGDIISVDITGLTPLHLRGGIKHVKYVDRNI